jgi:hypothetical protein
MVDGRWESDGRWSMVDGRSILEYSFLLILNLVHMYAIFNGIFLSEIYSREYLS